MLFLKSESGKLKNARSILIRCPNWVGDVVMATPVFEAVRKTFPNARIGACIRKYACGVIEDSPWFDDIIRIEDKSVAGLFRTAGEIRKRGYDAAILLTNSPVSFLEAKIGGVRNIYGYKRGVHKFFLSSGPEPEKENGKFKALPMTRYYLGLCEWLGIPVPENPKPRLFITPQLERKAQDLFEKYKLDGSKFLIGLNPGAKFGSSKCWPPEYFAKLAELLEKDLNAAIILLIGPGEDEIAEQIIRKCGTKIINTAPDKLDLSLLKAVIRRLGLLITNDTGPRHYAVAFDIPTVVLMGPTNPVYTESNLDKTVVIREESDCSPCHLKICPSDHRCMRNIKPEKVLEEVKKLLKRESNQL